MMKRAPEPFLFVLAAILILSPAHPVWGGNPELPAVKVAFSDDQSILTERVLYTALMRSGFQMVVRATGMRTAITDVNNGDAAILPAQTDGLDRMYPNLIIVPVVLDHVEFSVYSLSDRTYHFSEWGDMAGLRLGYRWQNEYIANNIRRAGASELVRVNDFDELWDSLLDGDADAIILPRFSYFEHRFPQGVKRAGVIERQPVYSYVNNHYSYLVPLLEKAYREMIADGTLALIYSGEKLSGNKPSILHINSYNAQNELERHQMELIRRNLETKTALDYYSINLNSNEPHSQINFNNVISEMIRTDFIARYPDLIIASGNEAFEFVLDNYFLLFPNLPVLFFGVSGLKDSMLYGLDMNITGVYETLSFHETAMEMLKSFPRTRRIIVLNDHHHSKSIRIQERAQKDLQTLFQSRDPPVEIIFNEDKPLSEILEDIRGLGSDTLVLIGNFLSDSEMFYSETDVQKLVSQASVNPVFCLTSSYIGHGTLGGMISSTDEKCNAVASMAVAILEGTPPNKIPVIFDSAFLNKWQYDYETVKKFNLNVKNLPKNHIFINRKLPIWESNPSEFNLLLTTAVLLMLIIIGLVVFFIRNTKMTRALHNTAMQLQIAAREANNANEAKSNFLAKMSHEIRTPMNAILGIAEIQLRSGNLSPDTGEAIEKIYESGDLLLSIINDILDLSKIEAGKLELVPVNYDMPSLINDTVQLNRLRYDSKPIDFTIHVDENTPHDLYGDELRIKQVLNNILSNAFKYTDEGTVEFIVSSPEQGNSGEDVTLVFRVRDTGQGMTEEQVGSLFEEYIRFNSQANRKTVGTGLGMSITKHLLELMNGEISVESKLGIGSEFTVRIPQKRIGPDVCGSDVAGNLRNFNFRSTTLNRSPFLREYMPYGSVLVVDDVESNIYVIKGMLLPYGIQIETASSGFEAIDKIKDGNEYDIVFMDHMMPKMNGIEAVKIIRDTGYSRSIIALTANALIGQAKMFMQNGFDGFISKPIDSRELNLILNDLIRNKKPPEVIEAARREMANLADAARQKNGSDPVATPAAATPLEEASQKPPVDGELAAAVVGDIENALAVLEKLLPGINSGGADLGLFTTTVHGMKSAFANIGEMPLSNAAYRLEQAGNNGDIAVISAGIQGFMNELRSYMEKLNPPETDSDTEVSLDDMVYLRNILNEIKTACSKLMLRDAKAALAGLKQKAWPRATNDVLNEITLYLIRGECVKVVSVIDKAMDGYPA